MSAGRARPLAAMGGSAGAALSRERLRGRLGLTAPPRPNRGRSFLLPVNAELAPYQQEFVTNLTLHLAGHEPVCAQLAKKAKGSLAWISNGVGSRSRAGIVSPYSRW